MRFGYIDQILMFLMLFINFVLLFFLVIDYSTIMNIKDNIDSMTYYGAKMVGLGRDTENIAEGLNRIKIDRFSTIIADDIECVELESENHQAIFHIHASYPSSLAGVDDTTFHSKEVNYNQMSSFDVECELTLTNL
jgi:hypothetical protein